MRALGLSVLLLCLSLSASSLLMGQPPGLEQADKLYEQQNYADSADIYSKFLESIHPPEELWHASTRLTICRLRLGKYDEAVASAEEVVKRFAGTIREPRAHKILGWLFLTMPHQGTEKGGKYHRGVWDQGRHKDSTKSDQKRAISHMEKARDLYIALASTPDKLTSEEKSGLTTERIEAQFDLVAALTRFTPADQLYYPSGGEEHDPEDGTVGEEAEDADFSRHRWRPQRPRGIPVDKAGKPIFDPVPESYSSELPAGQKVKFLLGEIEKIDPTEERTHAALSVYRRAMLARARYGSHRLQSFAGWGDGGDGTQDQIQKAKLHELADHEALTLVGTRIARVTLPPDEDIHGLLRSVVQRYPKAPIAPEAQYALALSYQSREQYKEAIREFERLMHDFPGSTRAGSARAQIEHIRRPELVIEQTGVQLAGDPARLPITYRNTGKARFVAHRLDLERYIQDFMKRVKADDENASSGHDLDNLSYSLLSDPGDDRPPLYRKYLGEKAAEWDATLNDAGDLRYAHADVESPLKDAGCYVVEGNFDGLAQPARNLVLLSDLAIVRKKFKDQQLFWTVDARTGQPVPGTSLTHFQYWVRWGSSFLSRKERQHYYSETRTATSDEQGLSLFKADQKFQSWPQIVTIAKSPKGSLAFNGVGYWNEYYSPSAEWAGRRTAVFTDRPVYRPLQTVKFKAWARDYSGGQYTPARQQRVNVEVRDPKGNVVYRAVLPLDEYGSVDGQFKLEKAAPLGLYNLSIGGYGGAGSQFRVEEYKKPEFEVTVQTKSQLVRLGDAVDGKIEARYLFGAPVSKAKVTYKIFRETYEHHYVSPGYWDWLYGAGYGCVYYPYDWLPWWRSHGPRPHVWYPWWGAPPKAQRELVAEGAGDIGEDGTLPFRVETAKALENHPDQDHLYTIEAEVVDASRRTITGRGEIKVTRQEFYCFTEVDRGYYQPGQQIFVKVKALTANDVPVASAGKLLVAAIRYQGEAGAQATEEPLQTLDAATDAEGNFQVTLTAGKSGQYKIAYETKDSQGRPVVGAYVVWVAGADFQGSIHRFNDLEILTDKRSYEPGETAHLLVNTSRAGASVLFSERVDQGALTNYKVIALTDKSTTLDVPIVAKDVPNFFVEGTVVVGGKVRQEARELVVPPKDSVMNVEVKPDKPEYQPGEKAQVRVKTTSPDGKPISAQLAVSVFDRSVLYIQPELTPDLRAHYWGTKRSHSFQMSSNLLLTFQPLSYIQDPKQYVEADPAADWHGSWGMHSLDFATDDLEGGALGFAAGGGGGGGRSRRMSMMKSKGGPMESAMDAAAPAAPAPAGAAPMAEAKEEARADKDANAEPQAQQQPAYKAATVRAEFEDTAFWTPSLVTDAAGEATFEFRFPENLTTWKMRALGMTQEARVGDGSGSATTTKKFVLRLQAPRFFVERDRVTLSANLHNYLSTEKKAKVSIAVPTDLMELVSPSTVEVTIPAGKEARVDWEVSVKQEGFAVVKMEGLTDEESDAMQMGFPVLVHGIEKTVSKTGLIRPSGADFAELALDVPAERRPEASRLELRFSPSLAGAMIEAVPYLLDFPYGCTEQTMSRFLPAVLVQKSLMTMGLSLEDLARKRTNLNSQEIGSAGERYERQRPLGDAPVFSQKVLSEIVAAGLERLKNMQLPSGGWGWWANDQPSPYMTSYVVWGLVLAGENDVAIDGSMIERGYQALQSAVTREMKDWEKARGAGDEQAFVAYVLSLKKKDSGDLNELLMERRAHLSLYGKALLSLALRGSGDAKGADLVLQNIRQVEKQDAENQTNYYELPQHGWWYWWNNDIETHAWILRAILAKDVNDPAAPGIVKWLLNNRRNGTYWRSTRDTAIAIGALIDYMRLTREIAPDFQLRVMLDGQVLKDVRVTRDNMFSFDNSVTLTGAALTSGLHKLRLERKGTGAVYFSSYLTYFTKEEGIKGTGLEVKVDRKYYKLVRSDRTETVQGSRLQDVSERHLRYERLELKDGDSLQSGDQLEVELKLTSKNDYDYLVFEDYKPAGCEPVDLRSGSRFGELCSNMELRDEKVAFFIGMLSQGEHLVKYRLRAEIPGTFHALPTKGWAMYAPEIRTNADEMVLGIKDK